MYEKLVNMSSYFLLPKHFSPAQRIGELHVVLSLEDWGPMNTQKIVVNGDSTSQAYSVSDAAQAAAPPAPPPEPRETQEYKAAMELEMWKEQQETVFENQVCFPSAHQSTKSLCTSFV